MGALHFIRRGWGGDSQQCGFQRAPQVHSISQQTQCRTTEKLISSYQECSFSVQYKVGERNLLLFSFFFFPSPSLTKVLYPILVALKSLPFATWFMEKYAYKIYCKQPLSLHILPVCAEDLGADAWRRRGEKKKKKRAVFDGGGGEVSYIVKWPQIYSRWGPQWTTEAY